jgi:hypothetical protein
MKNLLVNVYLSRQRKTNSGAIKYIPDEKGMGLNQYKNVANL